MTPEPDDSEGFDSIDISRYDADTRRAIISIVETLRQMELARERRSSHEFKVMIGGSSGFNCRDDESIIESASVSLGMGSRMIPSAKYQA